MTGRIPARVARPLAALLAATAVLALGASAAGAAEVVYNNIPGPKLPGNVPSLGFEAYSTSEFGGEVQLEGSARKNPNVLVAMSSWACQGGSWYADDCVSAKGAKFSWPMTLNIYEVGPENTVGARIASVEKTFSMPYRPSASSKCTGELAGDWYQMGSKECFHGKLFKVSFGMRKLTLPADGKVIVSVSYDTSDHGPNPVGDASACHATSEGCPYDSLNVAINAVYKEVAKEQYEAEPTSPSVGADPLPEDVFIDTTDAAMVCGNASLTGSFGASGACWRYEQPAFEIKAS